MPRAFTHIYTISHRNCAPSIDNASILLDRDSFLHETYVEIIQYFLFYGVFEPTSSFADRVVTLSSVWIIIARDYYRFSSTKKKKIPMLCSVFLVVEIISFSFFSKSTRGRKIGEGYRWKGRG